MKNGVLGCLRLVLTGGCGRSVENALSFFLSSAQRLSIAQFVKKLELAQVMSRHSWKDQSAQPKVKYFTQVKARPPTFVAFVSGKIRLSDTDIRFLTKSLKEDFNLGGIPIRIMQRVVPKKTVDGGGKSNKHVVRTPERIRSNKRSLIVE